MFRLPKQYKVPKVKWRQKPPTKERTPSIFSGERNPVKLPAPECGILHLKINNKQNISNFVYKKYQVETVSLSLLMKHMTYFKVNTLIDNNCDDELSYIKSKFMINPHFQHRAAFATFKYALIVFSSFTSI